MELRDLMEQFEDLSVDLPKSHHLIDQDPAARHEVKMMLVRGEWMRINAEIVHELLSKKNGQAHIAFAVSLLARAIQADETAKTDMET